MRTTSLNLGLVNFNIFGGSEHKKEQKDWTFFKNS